MTGTSYVESVERIVRAELARQGARSMDQAVWAFRDWLLRLRVERAIDLAEVVIESEIATAQGIAAVTGDPDELAGFIRCLRRARKQLGHAREELVEGLGNFEQVGGFAQPETGQEGQGRWKRAAEVGIP